MKSRLNFFVFILLLSTVVEGVEDLSHIDLDTYLKSNNVFVSEGYVTDTQKFGLIQDIKRVHKINKILEIGFNAGHSSEFFLENTDCIKLVSFDIGLHDYTTVGMEFMQLKYENRFTLIEGDSTIKVPEYLLLHPDEKFDLVFIDGGHSYDCILSDLQNCKQLANEETIVIIDDYVAEVKAVVDTWIENGQLILLDCKNSDEIYIPGINGGGRIWVVAKYII